MTSREDMVQVICDRCHGCGVASIGSEEHGYTLAHCHHCDGAGVVQVPGEDADDHMKRVAKEILAITSQPAGQDAEKQAI